MLERVCDLLPARHPLEPVGSCCRGGGELIPRECRGAGLECAHLSRFWECFGSGIDTVGSDRVHSKVSAFFRALVA